MNQQVTRMSTGELVADFHVDAVWYRIPFYVLENWLIELMEAHSSPQIISDLAEFLNEWNDSWDPRPISDLVSIISPYIVEFEAFEVSGEQQTKYRIDQTKSNAKRVDGNSI
jgi:hypothetical protein